MKRNSLMMLVVAALLLAAYGDRAPAEASPVGDLNSPAVDVSAAQGEAVTIQFLTIDDEDMLLATEQMIAAFQASDPQYANVSIEVQSVPFEQLFPTIETAVAAGAELDVFLADGPDIKHYAYNEAIIPLAEYYTEEELAEWVPQSVEEGSFNGTFYAPAIMQSCSLMFYNKDLTDAAGLEPPQTVQGWTMDEAWDAWQKTTVDDSGDGVPDTWGLRWGQGTYQGDYEHGIMRRSAGVKGSPSYMGIGEDGITFQGYLDTPEAIASFEDYRDWHQGDRAVTPQEPIDNIFFSKGAAFYVSPDNAVGTIDRLYPDGDFNYGVTGIPYYADGAQVCHTGSWHFGVSPQSQNQEISVAVAKFFAGPEGSKIWYDAVRQLPARIELLNTLPEYNEYPQQLFNEGLQTIGVPRIQTPGYTEYQQYFGELAQDIAQGEGVEVEALVHETAIQMEQALAKYEGWQEE
ncbi:MAG: extracellular solute-binding protein [Chloroflexia bacterium]|nr:extracellular solute-binding protein [Chloroflexia bacterium]